MQSEGQSESVGREQQDIPGLVMESPQQVISRLSQELDCSPTSLRLAEHLDRQDPLRHLRQEFLVPRVSDLPPGERIRLDQLSAIMS